LALAFLGPSPADVDAKYQELAALGHGHKEPWDAFWGQRYASVKDPDGTRSTSSHRCRAPQDLA
jgi:uncharacterized glyoxalase superfamily protein PhnB